MKEKFYITKALEVIDGFIIFKDRNKIKHELFKDKSIIVSNGNFLIKNKCQDKTC